MTVTVFYEAKAAHADWLITDQIYKSTFWWQLHAHSFIKTRNLFQKGPRLVVSEANRTANKQLRTLPDRQTAAVSILTQTISSETCHISQSLANTHTRVRQSCHGNACMLHHWPETVSMITVSIKSIIRLDAGVSSDSSPWKIHKRAAGVCLMKVIIHSTMNKHRHTNQWHDSFYVV